MAFWSRVPRLRRRIAHQRPRHMRHAQGGVLSLFAVRIRLHGAHQHRDGAEQSSAPQMALQHVLACHCSQGDLQLQLAKEIGVTQKTAWFILGRLREACGGDGPGGGLDKLRGTVEVDECFVGGLEANKHEHKKLKAGRGSVGKVAVLGCANAAGALTRWSFPIPNLQHIQNEIHGAVEAGSQLYTDEHGAYSDLDGLFFAHETVNHGAGEYARGRLTPTASRASGPS